MYIDLVLISIVVALVFESGFWDSLDEEINKRFKFHHLPQLLMCSLCQTWWLTFIYILVTGNLSIFNICVCLFLANMVDIWRPAFNLIKGFVLTLIDNLYNYIKY